MPTVTTRTSRKTKACCVNMYFQKYCLSSSRSLWSCVTRRLCVSQSEPLYCDKSYLRLKSHSPWSEMTLLKEWMNIQCQHLEKDWSLERHRKPTLERWFDAVRRGRISFCSLHSEDRGYIYQLVSVTDTGEKKNTQTGLNNQEDSVAPGTRSEIWWVSRQGDQLAQQCCPQN